MASPEKVCGSPGGAGPRRGGCTAGEVLTATLKWLIFCCEFHFNKKRRHKGMSNSGSSLSPLTLTAWTQGHPAPGRRGNLMLQSMALTHSNLASPVPGQRRGGGGKGEAMVCGGGCKGPHRAWCCRNVPCEGTTPLPRGPHPAHVECVTSHGQRDFAGVNQGRTSRREMTLVIWVNPKWSHRALPGEAGGQSRSSVRGSRGREHGLGDAEM